MQRETKGNEKYKSFGGEDPEHAGEDFLDTRINYGIVFKCTLKNIETIKKKILESVTKEQIVFQRASSNHLWICEDKPGKQ